MIFQPQSPTDETDAPDVVITDTAYWLNMKMVWQAYIDALRTHRVFQPNGRGAAYVKYNGYASLREYLAALNAQNAEIEFALGVMRRINLELTGNEWGL